VGTENSDGTVGDFVGRLYRMHSQRFQFFDNGGIVDYATERIRTVGVCTRHGNRPGNAEAKSGGFGDSQFCRLI
jgi:hypothetical protein